MSCTRSSSRLANGNSHAIMILHTKFYVVPFQNKFCPATHIFRTIMLQIPHLYRPACDEPKDFLGLYNLYIENDLLNKLTWWI